ncbi:MAG TPA: hypothetical protein VLG68_09570 [Gammaproteobacteria bacterium]|nr:hypothetical protein [Gammaproteobacteria bacterium]
MLATLLSFFLLVAAAGAMLAVLEARGARIPLVVGALHGAAASVGIVLLVVHDIGSPGNRLVNAATVIFILTATGGLLLFGFRAVRQKLPFAVVLLHAAFALTAIFLLTAGYLGDGSA